jgi:hypothetical protein
MGELVVGVKLRRNFRVIAASENARVLCNGGSARRPPDAWMGKIANNCNACASDRCRRCVQRLDKQAEYDARFPQGRCSLRRQMIWTDTQLTTSEPHGEVLNLHVSQYRGAAREETQTDQFPIDPHQGVHDARTVWSTMQRVILRQPATLPPHAFPPRKFPRYCG